MVLGDWKEIISNRLITRKNNNELYEILLNQVEKRIDSLLCELAEEYNINCSVTGVGEHFERKWIIQIEDEKHELTLSIAAEYYKNYNNLSSAISNYIVDSFQFVS